MGDAPRAALPSHSAASQGPESLRSGHRSTLVLALVVVGLSAALRITPDDQAIAVPGLHGTPLPSVCVLRGIVGVRCPGCGLTRSFVATAHGEIARALRLHPVGPALFLLLALQIPYRAYMLRASDPTPGPRARSAGRWLGWAFLAAFVIHWVLALAVDVPALWG